MEAQLFDSLSDVYEALVDWPKRLANEEPFFRRVVERFNARRVLDAACGTGRHAARFHAWGLEVEGADLSPAMVARARDRFGELEGLRFSVRSFTASVAPAPPFDVVVCVGNSLALAPDATSVEQALVQMMAATKPRGGLVLQVLNLWHLPDGPCRWQKFKRLNLGHGDIWVAKGVHRCAARGYVDLLVAPLAADGPAPYTESIPFLGLDVDALQAILRQAGAVDLQCFGGYQEQPYDRTHSTDLLLVAQKA
jgi:glycine/sarcosine N-methyltransferase